MLYYFDLSDYTTIDSLKDAKVAHVVKTINNEFISKDINSLDPTYNIFVDYKYMVSIGKSCINFYLSTCDKDVNKALDGILKIKPIAEDASHILIYKDTDDDDDNNIVEILVFSDDYMFTAKVAAYICLNYEYYYKELGILFLYADITQYIVKDTYDLLKDVGSCDKISNEVSYDDLKIDDIHNTACMLLDDRYSSDEQLNFLRRLFDNNIVVDKFDLEDTIRKITELVEETFYAYSTSKNWKQLYLENVETKDKKYKYVQDTLDVDVWDNFEEFYQPPSNLDTVVPF